MKPGVHWTSEASKGTRNDTKWGTPLWWPHLVGLMLEKYQYHLGAHLVANLRSFMHEWFCAHLISTAISWWWLNELLSNNQQEVPSRALTMCTVCRTAGCKCAVINVLTFLGLLYIVGNFKIMEWFVQWTENKKPTLCLTFISKL